MGALMLLPDSCIPAGYGRLPEWIRPSRRWASSAGSAPGGSAILPIILSLLSLPVVLPTTGIASFRFALRRMRRDGTLRLRRSLKGIEWTMKQPSAEARGLSRAIRLGIKVPCFCISTLMPTTP